MGRESLAVVSSPPSATAPSTAVSATSLAPGFRFHPTDEELVSYYLKRKVLGKPVRFDAIGEVDIYKHEPWDLAGSLGFFFFISAYLYDLGVSVNLMLLIWDFCRLGLLVVPSSGSILGNEFSFYVLRFVFWEIFCCREDSLFVPGAKFRQLGFNTVKTFHPIDFLTEESRIFFRLL
jgi:hypothetical protein